MKKGIFISLEGPDGSGKTSIMQALAEQLRAEGVVLETTREPGGVEIAEEIRSVILDPKNTSMDDKTELLLYIAARRQHLMERVVPALEAGKALLVDRFIDSSVAYQGYGRGLAVSDIDWLNNYATDGLVPDLTLYLDIPAEEGLARIAKHRSEDVDRLDLEAIDLHHRVREGYLQQVAKYPGRFVQIDARQPFEAVLAEALRVVKERLALR